MSKNTENKADTKFKGGLIGAMMGGAIGGGGHWVVEKFMPTMASGKLNKNTMVATALTTAALGAYIGAVEMWETYLPPGKKADQSCPSRSDVQHAWLFTRDLRVDIHQEQAAGVRSKETWKVVVTSV
jgi:hypothetical protein